MLKKLIEIALAEVGYREGANNDNKYGIEYGLNHQPWCVIFLWWCFKAAGLSDLFPAMAHCNQVEAHAKKLGQWVTGDYIPGDLVIWDYDGDGSRDHIGLVIEANGDSLTTVEGNYADKVSEVKRKASDVVGAYRPEYGEEDLSPQSPDGDSSPWATRGAYESELPVLRRGDYGPAVRSLQAILAGTHHCNMRSSVKRDGTFDGEFGNDTETALRAVTGKTETDAAAWVKIIGGKR